VSRGLMGAVLRMYGRHLPALVVTIAATLGTAAAVRPLGSDVLTLVACSAAAALAAALVLVVLRGWFRAELGVVGSLRGGRAPVTTGRA